MKQWADIVPLMTGVIKRPEFPYLDGLRGGAALVVVVYHAFLYSGNTGAAKEAMPWLAAVVGFGYIGVAVFIVLSGYVLMLPVATTRDLTFRGGTWSFVKRRARRILPPYYAAVLFALLMVLIFPVMQQPADTAWDSKLPVTPAAIISHLFLVHDLSPAWVIKINGPLWSVAVEWQIYFVMALLLIPLWRRIPAPVIVGSLLVLTLVPLFLSKGLFLHPWFVALFAAGMWAAQLTLAPKEPRALGLITILLIALVPVSIVVSKLLHLPTTGTAETTAGLAVAAALVWLGRRELAGQRNPIARPLRSRPMMYLGLFSYSLYLFHSPVLGLVNLLTLPWGLPIWGQYLLVTFLGIPVAMAVSWAMFWVVERHFLNARQKHAKAELADHAVVTPVEHAADSGQPSPAT